MIAADTSAWIDFSKGAKTAAAQHLEAALAQGSLVMPLPVLFEVLSGPGLTSAAERFIRELPTLEQKDGFWARAGELRRVLLKKGLKARSMDCLIALSCLDHEVPLIASDQDYRHYIRFGLKLS
jgi:predicted nucleic acid-binding protein